MILLRALSHLVAFVLLTALALAGLAAALFSIGSGSEGLSLPSLANLLALPALEEAVGTFLGGLEGGSLGNETALFGALAVLVSLLLLLGALRNPAERTMLLADRRAGRIAARRRPLGQAVAALASRARGVAATKVRVKPRRRGLGGRIEVAAMHSRRSDPKEVDAGVTESLKSLAGESRSVKVRTRPYTGGAGARAE
ncbi:MAG: hypothetical protein H0X56_03275 [Solirubrobacterales bacterium]|nr:hypothetical protein [Thermoleophilaceae bacterium]MBA3860973.1 hypothetical protein [Solirubrobacterales bacterium]